MRAQRRYEHQRILDVAIDLIAIRFDSIDTVLAKRVARVRQQHHRVQEIVNDERLENVELEIALRSRDRNRRVVADHLNANHRHRFALGWIDFTGHDRRARLVLRQR